MVICYRGQRKLIHPVNQYPTFSSLGQSTAQGPEGQTQPSITSLAEELPTALRLCKDNSGEGCTQPDNRKESC